MERFRHPFSSALYAVAAWVEPFDAEAARRLEAIMAGADARCSSLSLPLALPCTLCHRRIVAGFSVDREVWKAVLGDETCDDDVCLPCFDVAAERLHVRYDLLALWAYPWHDMLQMEPKPAIPVTPTTADA